MDVQLGVAPLDQNKVDDMVSATLGLPLQSGLKATDRLALVDQLLQTGSERGLVVRSKQMLVMLIESIVKSPAYGPELGRSQKNLELLLREEQQPLETQEVARLMNAYAYRQDWDRFWDAFRSPTRFNLPRPPQLYELGFRTMASTKDAKLCTGALRWVYPEMLMEKPAVMPQGELYRSLKSCILVADHLAEELLLNPPPTINMSAVDIRRVQQREFVKVLRDVEALRQHVGQINT